MITYIALLRGINVGGHKKVPMAILRELLSNLGFKNVKTYIQTGNVIFQFSEKNSNLLEELILKTIASHFGFNVKVIVKTKQELQSVFDACVFLEDKKTKSYFILLSKVPEANLVNEANKITFENEEFAIVNNCIYYYSSIGYGRAKFNMNSFEKKLNSNATSRNYNTIKKLLELS